MKPDARAVIGAHIKLTPQKQTLVADCPFCHAAHALHVHVPRDYFYCFGCHESGTSARFVGLFTGASKGEAVLAAFLGLDNQLGMSAERLAGLVGISPHTIRLVRATRQMPKHSHCREAIAAFVSARQAAE